MNNTEIVKVLNLLDKYDYDGAKLFLQEQLLKQENKEKYNLIPLVKKIIFNKELIKARQSLAKVQILNDKQSVVDGFVGIKWKIFEDSLNILPQNKENPFDLDKIFFDGQEYNLTENDKLIINNLSAVMKYVKQIRKDEEKDTAKLPIFLFNKVFDLCIIQNVLKICLLYNEELSFETYKDNSIYTPVQIENSHIKAIILPMRVTDAEEITKISDLTETICNKLRKV